jgi:hypothetical protein
MQEIVITCGIGYVCSAALILRMISTAKKPQQQQENHDEDY